MKVLFDNVNIDSRSGPNGFAKKLKKELNLDQYDCEVLTHIDKKFTPDIQLSFIMSDYEYAPIIQRLDGIYFNTDQDFNDLNSPLKATYEVASAVIFQSEFNKKLSEKWFGKKEKSAVIHNGTDFMRIEKIKPLENSKIDKFEKVWSCASSWRPHKRLSENIRYFLENSGKNDCLIVAGENPDKIVSNSRIFYAGNLGWEDLIGVFKRSDFFIHLSWLDHCPNVVIDARAAGCHVICSSSGGTKEISGKDSTIIQEAEWDFSPIKLYSPPILDFSKRQSIQDLEVKIQEDITIQRAALEYFTIIKEVYENENLLSLS